MLSQVYGTPLYVVGEEHFRARIRRYLQAFQAAYPKSELTFASKANSALALLAIAHEEGCLIDVASEGELRAALRAGVPPQRCHLHGNNKTRQELHFAIDQGISQIVVDHFGEIETIQELVGSLAEAARGRCPGLVLRLAPGVDPVTHHKISTGQADTKFGFNITDGSAEKATLRCLELGLPLVGFHCHVGSQLLDPEAQISGGELIAQFAVLMKERHGFEAKFLNVGGGLGVRYTDEDRPMEVEEYCGRIGQAVQRALEGSGLSPALTQEPGRSLIAESGVTLYEVGVLKSVPVGETARRLYVCVDGGMSDNPRPALYGSRYTVERVARGAHHEPLPAGAAAIGAEKPGLAASAPTTVLGGVPEPMQTVTVSGRHCETDKLFVDISLPADLAIGDLIQVLCTGAYNASMASNYNRYPRPAMVLLREAGQHALIQRRDTWDEMFAREQVPEGFGAI